MGFEEKLFKFLNNTKKFITIIGSGGKTTTMYYLAEKFVEKFNKNVLITTTTKIFYPENYKVIITDSIEKLKKISDKIVVSGGGVTKENKIIPLDLEVLSDLRKYFSLILIEGDGSKGKSLKGYADYEPVIPDFTDIVITIIGMDILGKPFNENYVHRFEILKKILKKEENEPITVNDIKNSILKSYIPQMPANTINYLILNKILEKDFKNVEKLKKEILAKISQFKEIFLIPFQRGNNQKGTIKELNYEKKRSDIIASQNKNLNYLLTPNFLSSI